MLDGYRYVKVRGTVAPDQPRRPCWRLVQRQARWVARANQLIQAFLAIARERRGHDLEPWMAEATHSGIDELARAAPLRAAPDAYRGFPDTAADF